MGRKYKRLNYKDRTEIEKMCKENKPPKDIAASVGVHVATIYTELHRGEDENGVYSADTAQRAIG